MTTNGKTSDTAQPSLNGLVLAGGRSTRMGRDKSALQWHGKEQVYYMADLLAERCGDVYISTRPEQQATIDPHYKTIPDAWEGLGPYGAILSAFKTNDACAWLVIACDLPLLDRDTLSYLIEHRNTASVATTFESPHDGLPEPLVTIWEPKSYAVLLSFLSQGRQCPRKALINSDVAILKPLNPDALANVNTPQELERIKGIMEKNSLGYHGE